MTKTKGAVLAATLLPGLLLLSRPAPAAPTGTRIAAIFQLDRCEASPCEAGRDPQVAADAAVRGTIQVHLESSAPIVGLDWVRLTGRFCRAKVCDGNDDPRPACIEEWSAGGATTFSRTLDWKTPHWHYPRGEKPPRPWGCNELNWHWHGAPTFNQWFFLQVTARDRVNGQEQSSPEFRFRMANPASQPVWVRAPVVSTDASGRPTVTLEWKPNAEPDVVEYHFARAGPGGQSEFVVDAAKPEKQGCRKLMLGNPPKVNSLICEDRAFPQTAFNGIFRYAVYAYRPAPSGKMCSLSRQPCFESRASAVRSIAVGGAAAPAGAATPSPTAGAPAEKASPTSQAPAPIAVAGGDREELAPPAAKNTGMLPIALGVLLAAGLALTAVRVTRRLRGGADSR